MIYDENVFKKHKILIFIFTTTIIINAIIACLVGRSLYLDGSLQFNAILNQLSFGHYGLFDDWQHHPRLYVNFINQLLINFSYYILQIKTKSLLLVAHALPLFALPPLALWWNYKLSQKTKRFDIALWSLFVYAFLVVQSSIEAITETNLASIVYFILFNYLAGKIDYKKKDIIIIFFLVLFLFRSHEMVLFLGPIIFLASLFYASQEESNFNKKIKYFIGAGSLFASFYMLYWFLTRPIMNETIRFLYEAVTYSHSLLNLNILLTIVGLLVAFIAIFKKSIFSKLEISIILIIYSFILAFMFKNLNIFLNPTMELHLRTIHCWAIPLIFTIIFGIDFLKIKINNTYYSNLLVIICIVGISQTIWQINNSYWFYKDFEYLKSKLVHSKTLLLNPDENQDLFDYSKYRRYQWKYSYFNSSLAISNDYKLKALLNQSKTSNGFSEWLYKKNDHTISVPEINLSIKNKFWDLTDIANNFKNGLAYEAKEDYEIFDNAFINKKEDVVFNLTKSGYSSNRPRGHCLSVF